MSAAVELAKAREQVEAARSEPVALRHGVSGSELLARLKAGPIEPTYLESETFARTFYAPGIALFAGHPKSGKTLAIMVAAVECAVSGQHVVYFDYENGPDEFFTRLWQAGGMDQATADALAERLHYIYAPKLADGIAADIERVARQWPGALVIVDSLTTAMASSGVADENDSMGLAGFLAPFCDAVRGNGLTAIVIDHTAKGGSDASEYVTRGSSAKEALVDSVTAFTKAEDFDADRQGKVRIKATRARRGGLVTRSYVVGGQGWHGRLRFAAAADDAVAAKGATGLRIHADVLTFFMAHAGRAVSRNEIAKAVTGDDKAVRAEVEVLLCSELPVRTEGDGRYPKVMYDPTGCCGDLPPI